MLYTYLKIGNKDTNICLIERKLVFLQRRKCSNNATGLHHIVGKKRHVKMWYFKCVF